MEPIIKRKPARKALSLLLAFVMLLSATGAATLPTFAAGESAKGYPFLLGAAKGADNKPVPLMSYTLGTNPGTVPLDGSVHNYPLAETLARFETRPVSGHPDGTAYMWVYDDATSVYFVCDWTSDNTLDDGEDYFTVYVDSGAGVNAYTQHTEPIGGAYGEALFDFTGTADYRHMYYVIAVPKAELNGDALNVGFELYGTAAAWGTLSWHGTAPTTAATGQSTAFTVDYDLTTYDGYYHGDPIDPAALVLFEYTDTAALNNFINSWYWFDTVDNEFVDLDPATSGITVLGTQPFDIVTDSFQDHLGAVSGSATVNYAFTAAGTHNVAAVICHQNGSNEDGSIDPEYIRIKYGTDISFATTAVTVTGAQGGGLYIDGAPLNLAANGSGAGWSYTAATRTLTVTDNITVTGAVSGQTEQLIISIADYKNVDWQADYSSDSIQGEGCVLLFEGENGNAAFSDCTIQSASDFTSLVYSMGDVYIGEGASIVYSGESGHAIKAEGFILMEGGYIAATSEYSNAVSSDGGMWLMGGIIDSAGTGIENSAGVGINGGFVYGGRCAIYSFADYPGSYVAVHGGVVYGSEFAIYSRAESVIVDGGLVLCNGTDYTDAIIHTGELDSAGGIIAAFDNTRIGPFADGTHTALVSSPANALTWAIQGGHGGVAYGIGEFLDLGVTVVQLQTQTLYLDANATGANPFHLGSLTGTAYTGQTDKYIWDGAAKTLTLKGFEWTTGANVALAIDANDTADINIVLQAGMVNSFVSTYSGDDDTHGLWVDSGGAVGNATISGEGTLNVTAGESAGGGSIGLAQAKGDLTISGGTVNATGGPAVGWSAGISTLGKLRVSGGTVTAVGGASDDPSSYGSYGILPDGNVIISGGAVTAKGYTRATDTGFTVNAPAYDYWTNTAAAAPASKTGSFPGTAFANSNTYKYVKIAESGSAPLTTTLTWGSPPPATTVNGTDTNLPLTYTGTNIPTGALGGKAYLFEYTDEATLAAFLDGFPYYRPAEGCFVDGPLNSNHHSCNCDSCGTNCCDDRTSPWSGITILDAKYFTPGSGAINFTANFTNSGTHHIAAMIYWKFADGDVSYYRYDTAPVKADITSAAPAASAIHNRAEMEAVALAPGGSYVLANDIDLSGAPWTPIAGFTGTFDGAGRAISGMYIEAPAEIGFVNADTFPAIYNVYEDDKVTAFGIGLFANTNGAYIHDLTLDAPSWNIEWAENMSIVLAGALTGYSKDDKIRGVSVTIPDIRFSAGGDAELAYAVGGAIGLVSGARPVSGISVTGGTIKTHRGNVTGEGFYFTGGVFGESFNSVIVNAASATNVYHSASGSTFWSAGTVGGIAGGIYARNTLLFCLHNSYSRSNVTYEDKGDAWSGEVYLGGIAGELIDSAVNNYYVPAVGGGISIVEPHIHSWQEHRVGILFGYANDASATDVPYIIDRDYYYDIDGMPQAGRYWFEGDVEFTQITTPEALLAALNEGRPAVVAAYQSQYGETITLDKVFEWVIEPGKNDGWPIFRKVASVFVAVTNITGVPATATAGTGLNLTGTVAPANATNKTITWSVKNAGTTGASISGNTLNTTAAGTVVVTATIVNGAAASADYTQDFIIAVNAAPPVFVAVTGITGVPATATAGTGLNLTGTVAPANATNKTIAWSVKNAGTSGASISGNILNTTAAGTVVVTATITNGAAASVDYTQDFIITVSAAAAAPYTITFNANGGAVSPAIAVTGADGKLSGLPSPTRSGSYTFDGWFTAASGGAQVTTATVFTANTTVYARWAYTGSAGGSGGGMAYYATTYNTITFNSNGGKSVSSQSIAHGGKASKPADPAKDGFAFAGWYKDAALTQAYDFSAGVYTGLTLYAKWTETIPGAEPPLGPVFPFIDARESDWFYGDVEYVWSKSLMTGTAADKFSPDMNLTRGMIVTILYRHAGEPDVSELTNPFDDVPAGAWYTGAVIWAAENKIAEGYGNGKYGPDDAVSRQDLAAILYRYANAIGVKLPVTRGYSGFADDMDCSSYAKDAIEAFFKAGIISGHPDGSFRPKGTATRAEVAAMLHRFLEAIEEEK